MFSVLSPGDLEERSTEFLALASSNLLRLGLETSSNLVSAAEISGTSDNSSASRHASNLSSASGGNRDSVYLLFDEIVRLSPVLTANLQEACFPYALIRSAHNHLVNGQCLNGNSKSSGATTLHHHLEASQYRP